MCKCIPKPIPFDYKSGSFVYIVNNLEERAVRKSNSLSPMYVLHTMLCEELPVENNVGSHAIFEGITPKMDFEIVFSQVLKYGHKHVRRYRLYNISFALAGSFLCLCERC